MFRRGGNQERFDERDVRSLDRDLRQIVIEERCSYGAELRAQLIEEHARLEGGRRSRSWSVSAVGIAAMLMLALACFRLPSQSRRRGLSPSGREAAILSSLHRPSRR